MKLTFQILGAVLLPAWLITGIAGAILDIRPLALIFVIPVLILFWAGMMLGGYFAGQGIYEIIDKKWLAPRRAKQEEGTKRIRRLIANRLQHEMHAKLKLNTIRVTDALREELWDNPEVAKWTAVPTSIAGETLTPMRLTLTTDGDGLTWSS